MEDSHSVWWAAICKFWEENEPVRVGEADLIFVHGMPQNEWALVWRQASSTKPNEQIFVYALERGLTNLEWEAFSSFDATRFCARLRELPQGAQVIVLDAEHLRYPEIDTSTNSEVKGPQGLNIRMQLASVIPLDHIFNLGVEVAQIAAELELRCLIVCGGVNLRSKCTSNLRMKVHH
ncbi:MAG: hypothetical protein WD490_05335, partial [Opitutales bacterium]